MKIAIIGSKGIPASYGGFETFAEQISFQFQKSNYEIVVVGDKSTKSERISSNIYNHSINIEKSLNPLLFWHKSIKYVKNHDFDRIIHCGVAGIFSHLYFYSLNNKTYINPDGLGFYRSKYGLLKKIFLAIQFVFCSLFAKNIICDSHGIKSFFKNKLFRSKRLYVAEYGSVENKISNEKELLFHEFCEKFNFNLKSGYFLVVSRLEPENNIEIIIKAYNKTGSKKPLIIVGGLNTKYYHSKLKKYNKNDSIIFTDGIYNAPLLQILRLKCTAYIHGHSVGGTNPSLIEAMSSRNMIIAHNNPFNAFVLGKSGTYFKNISELRKIFQDIDNNNSDLNKKELAHNLFSKNFTWEKICEKYISILNEI